MSHQKHLATLKTFFSHPISMNVHWKDVVHLFESLGAEVEVVHGGREKVKLNGQEHTFHIPHSRVIESKDEMLQIKRFLERCHVTPETFGAGAVGKG